MVRLHLRIRRFRRLSAPPTNKKQLRSFLGLVGWYQKFIPNYAEVTVPLTNALREGTPHNVNWENEHLESFSKLKECITSAPVLKAPDFTRPFILQTDASDHAVGAALLQEFHDGLLPVAFVSKKVTAS